MKRIIWGDLASRKLGSFYVAPARALYQFPVDPVKIGYMHPAVSSLVGKLRQVTKIEGADEEQENGGVASLARVYEAARNALEYRADHLVSRATIERMLRRHVILETDAAGVVTELVKELQWVGLVRSRSMGVEARQSLGRVIEKYLALAAAKAADRDWLLSLMSAEVEDQLMPDAARQHFTNFAFQVLKERTDIDQEDADLLLFVALDRIYAESDEPRVAFHLYQLLRGQMGKTAEEEIISETWRVHKKVRESKLVNKLSTGIRRQMGPLVLLRDMYYANPAGFGKALEDEELFVKAAREVLADQLNITHGRISRATWRSVLYVFLTKMIFGLVLEVPVEKYLNGEIQWIGVGINILVPVILMWLVVAGVRLPDEREQKRLIDRAREIVFSFDHKAAAEEIIKTSQSGTMGTWEMVFYLIYGGFSVLIFTALVWGLISAGLNLINVGVFIFFVSIIMFFAFKIRRTANIYTYRVREKDRVKLWEMLALPIVGLGGLLSRGLTKANFLVLVFDFILEAPFKMILGFADSWVGYVSLKRDELVG